jgi:hypothetical protein
VLLLQNNVVEKIEKEKLSQETAKQYFFLLFVARHAR